MIWNIPTSTISGRLHQQRDIPTQDFVRVKLDNDFACVTMADGAGSARYAGEGAKLVAEEVRERLLETGKDLFEMNDDELSGWLISWLQSYLNEEATKREDCTLKDFSCTLLFFVSDGEQYIAGNLGDGLVGYVTPSNEGVTLLGQEHGQTLVETWFVTGQNAASHLRICRGEFDVENVYFLMTDGTCECLYVRNKQTFAPAMYTFADWVRRFKFGPVQYAIKNTMSKLFTEITPDDCALALIHAESGKHGESAE